MYAPNDREEIRDFDPELILEINIILLGVPCSSRQRDSVYRDNRQVCLSIRRDCVTIANEDENEFRNE